MTIVERAVLMAAKDGPIWLRSLGMARGVADRLEREGLMERVSPPNGKARNMIKLSAAGRKALGKR